MNLQYLKYALEVEKTGSISKAAENLFMNQPNLSKAIKELEAMIGVSLFERTTKGVSATTREGRVFMEYAKNILGQFEGMKLHFQTVTPKKNAFRISIPRASYIAEAFTSFIDEINEKDDFYISFQETNSMQAIKSITQDGYNLGIIRYRTLYENYFLSFLKEKELVHQEILEADSVIIMSLNNRLSNKAVLELSDLDNMIEISNDDFAMPRHYLPADKSKVDSLPPSRRQILVFERGSQFDLLSRIHKTFMWVSPMPQDVLTRNGLVQKNCNAKDISFKDVLIYRRGHTFSELEQFFLDKLEMVKNSILSSKNVV